MFIETKQSKITTDALAIRDLTLFMQSVSGVGLHVQRDSRGTPFTNFHCPQCGERVNMVMQPSMSWHGKRCFVGFDLRPDPLTDQAPAHFLFTNLKDPMTGDRVVALDCLSPVRADLDEARVILKLPGPLRIAA